jgi:hypothetical protein
MKKPKIVGDKENGKLSSIEPCDYCGGIEYYSKEQMTPPTTTYGFYIEALNKIDGTFFRRVACTRCFIKALDKLLGAPAGEKYDDAGYDGDI